MLATAPTTATNAAPAADHPTARRAVRAARQMYPAASSLAATGVTDSRATVLVAVGDQVRIISYQDLDRGPRCPICGAPLAA